MVRCPSCKTEIEADFGMISCPHCSTMFMVEMDGTVKEAGEIEEEYPEADPADITTVQAPESEDLMGAVPESEDGSPNSDIQNPADTEQEIVSYNEGEAAGTSDNWEGQADSTMVEAGAEASENLYADDNQNDADATVAQSFEGEEPKDEEAQFEENFMDALIDGSPEPKPATDDPLGVTSFAQSEASQLTEGMYYYDLKIAGLDSAEIRQSVIDALTDDRFDWLPEDVRKRIVSGRLVLPNLNPVKAVLAVIKLQHLDVEVDWDQKLFTEESVEKNDQGDAEA